MRGLPARLGLALALVLGQCQASPAFAAGVPLTGLGNRASPVSTDVLPIEATGSTTLLNISLAQLATYFSTSVGGAAGTSGQLQYNNAGALGGFTLSGDCTLSEPSITCLKTNGVAFAASATIDATNASNIASGSLNAARLAAGAAAANLGFTPPGIHGAPTGGDCVSWYSATAVADAGAACGAAAGTVTTTGSPASGNLAAFSGAATITAGNLSGDCSTSGSLALTCALAASKITSGTLATARLGSGTASSGTYLRGDQTWATPPAGATVSGTPTTGDCVQWAGPSAISDAGAACGSGSSGAMVLLASATTTSSQTSVTFSSISQAYHHLRVVLNIIPIAGSNIDVSWQFNSDAVNHYDWDAFGTSNSSPSSVFGGGAGADTQGHLSAAGASSGTPNTSQYVVDITNYSLTSSSVYTWAGTGMWVNGGGLAAFTVGGRWRGSTAISTIKVMLADGSAMGAGSTLYLYGIN